MITGDHVVTASAIARDLGILTRRRPGHHRRGAGRHERRRAGSARCEHIAVYARVSPENKIRIVKAWQRQGQVVSMTGDGVNDAPALKAADIGCAMGITGTDVAKGAADMTLTDDNFATIVDAVREGRGIYANIRKVVGFLLGTNIGEMLTVFFAMILWHKTPLLSMQLLWINLMTDSLPAISLGHGSGGTRRDGPQAQEAQRKHLCRRPGAAHRAARPPVLRRDALLVLAGPESHRYACRRPDAGLHGAGAFAGVPCVQYRSNRSLFKVGIFTNRRMNQAALISLSLMALVLFVPPVRMVFELAAFPG